MNKKLLLLMALSLQTTILLSLSPAQLEEQEQARKQHEEQMLAKQNMIKGFRAEAICIAAPFIFKYCMATKGWAKSPLLDKKRAWLGGTPLALWVFISGSICEIGGLAYAFTKQYKGLKHYYFPDYQAPQNTAQKQ